MTSPPIKSDDANDHHPGLLWLRLGVFHDRVFAQDNSTRLKHLVVWLGIAGFVIHLLMIFLGKTLAHPPALFAGMGDSYLAAISTPFNFILFYEVTTLIGVLHESTTKSVAYQFEIVSLIFIRDVFKDLPDTAGMVAEHRMTWSALPLFVDMWAGFLMYLLVAVFQHVARRGPAHAISDEPSRAQALFVAQKKAVALGLGALLLCMAAYNLSLVGIDVYHLATGVEVRIPYASTFYNDLFTVMIFTDVLVLILSIVVSGQYERVFRSAAFVVSIVLIRFSLAEGYPFGPPLAILAMIFGILTLLVFNYHMRIADMRTEPMLIENLTEEQVHIERDSE